MLLRCARAGLLAPSASSRQCAVTVRAERLTLGNLAPAPGSRLREQRKGRGDAAGQGSTCGYGNRGQKARSGPSVRPGFEGGQMPLYRRLPKLKGIAGGNSAGRPDYVVVNVDKLNAWFQGGEEVTMEVLKEKGFVRASGRRRNLPLKVLGTGELKAGLTVKAEAFSAGAQKKIEAAGGSAVVVSPKPKWTKQGHKKAVAEMKAAGKDYAEEKKKKRVAALAAKGMLSKKSQTPKKVKAKPSAP